MACVLATGLDRAEALILLVDIGTNGEVVLGSRQGVDAVAAALEAGMLNRRGRIMTESGVIPLTDDLYLNQKDIHQVQLAKGAIAAGIALMAQHLGAALEDIERVYLAGAFGSFLDKTSACRMGLLPPALEQKVQAVRKCRRQRRKADCSG